MTLDATLSRLLAHKPALLPGHVWLVGAGPGDPALLTLEAVSALTQCDALVHDALVSGKIVGIAAQAEKFYVGKRGGRLSIPQGDINALLVRLAREGRKIVRLKGGHPLVFARGGEEALALVEAGVPYRVLPGVTSAFGGLATAGIPASMRGVNGAITLATGFAAVSDDRPDWQALARTGQPIVIYMGLTHMEATVGELLAGGLAPDTPAALIENATLPQERVVVASVGTLVEAAGRENVVSPALIVIGGIVALREKLQTTDTPTPYPSPQGGGGTERFATFNQSDGQLGGNVSESPSPLRGGVRGGGKTAADSDKDNP